MRSLVIPDVDVSLPMSSLPRLQTESECVAGPVAGIGYSEQDRVIDRPTPRVSVIIKALNEEHNIAAAVESAIAALRMVGGEVILADSASTDQTITIASRYPIKIVTLDSPGDRSCGGGVQLGFQYSSGEYVCLMDGDMRLNERFLAAAVRHLEDHPGEAGIGGMLEEREVTNLEFVKRSKSDDRGYRPGPVRRLDGGGVYRRVAIESIGYFGDRNLHGGEEMDLGARLYACGWTLARLDVPAIKHHGHSGSAYRLLLRRVKTRMAHGSGELLRAAIGRSHFRFVMLGTRIFAAWAAVYAWWLSMLAVSFWAPGPLAAAVAIAAMVILPVGWMSLRSRSVRLGLYSVVAWNVYAACFWPGLLGRRIPPADWIASSVVQKGTAVDAPR
jgi:glycosyltransferase involved in cell wall biosynthesis